MRMDYRSGLLHDKVAIIECHTIITGSFNWSAEANKTDRENLVVIGSRDWATAYERDFEGIWSASR
jgi:phosphatidylserine/phosphatidylglycerophosphate/cardiolipin synthase-like enzyme